MNNTFNKNNVIDLLIKKATGFYYTEEQCEYEKTQKHSTLNANYSNFNQNTQNSCNNINQLTIWSEPIETKNNSINSIENNENLTLTKKKITTHYISPDMLAIKILLEIYSKEIEDDNLSNLSDEELVKIKNKLINEVLNETNENK